MTEIKPLTISFCRAVARLHLSYLQTPFKGIPGQHLLDAYYRALVQSKGACGYVALSDENVSSYVCGVWSSKEVRLMLLRRQWPRLLFWGLVQIIICPSFLISLFARLKMPESNSISSAVGYELRPIVVDITAQGTGISVQLANRLFEDSRNRGFACVHLFAESNNGRANAFYRKLNFKPVGSQIRSGNTYIHYERVVT